MLENEKYHGAALLQKTITVNFLTHKRNLLTNVDVGALAICCDALSKFVKANQEIEKHGMLHLNEAKD